MRYHCFKVQKFLVYDHWNCSFDLYYGEVLKLDYFYAATFETILGSDYRSTYRSGAAVVKTSINKTNFEGCPIG